MTHQTDSEEPVIPPWLKYPEIKRGSIGWRMGYGEAYMITWDDWAETQNKTQLISYFKKYLPIPVEWLDWVANRLGYSVLNDEMAGHGEFRGIRWLEENGLANFSEFKSWYDEIWIKQWGKL